MTAQSPPNETAPKDGTSASDAPESGSSPQGPDMKAVLYAVLSILALLLGIVLLRALWVSINCTTILGTRVCR
jgi:hypothetical protein